MNLRAGIGYSFYADPENRLTLLMDVNKLLVPTPPRYGTNGEILDGKDPDRSVVSSFFGSFTDAPGGFREEIREFSLAAGMEYSYFRSEEHTSELQSLMRISYAVFCLKNKLPTTMITIGN